jgi:acetylornithine/N-succinyldiaminopimelate aminotransferase
MTEITQQNQHNSNTADLVDKAKQYLVPNYAQQPIVLDKGDGIQVVDVDGNNYVDFASGIAVTSLGHNHPALKAALIEASENIWHVSNVYYQSASIELAEQLAKLFDYPVQAFFCNSGGEANEAAIKVARRYHWLRAGSPAGAAKQHEIVSFRGGFHGRTLTTVTATAQPKYHEGFHPMPSGFVYADYNDCSQQNLDIITECTAAVILEGIQGEGGVRAANPEFIAAVQRKCQQTGALLIFDEIQTGICRTGQWFSYQHFTDVVPDIITTAKALGGGMPIGAMLAKPEVAEALSVGSHGSTFGGNPIACSVATAVIKTMHDINACEKVAVIEQIVKDRLTAINSKLDIFSEVRGMGAMIGAELKPAYAGKASEIVKIAAQRQLLVLVAGPDVLRLQFPLIISVEDLSAGLDLLEKVLENFVQAN